MQVFIILSIVVAILVIVFTLQNITPVTVVFLFWMFHGSLALVLFLALAAGAMICLFASLPSMIKGKWTIAKQKKKILEIENSLEEYRFKLNESQKRTSGEEKPRSSEVITSD